MVCEFLDKYGVCCRSDCFHFGEECDFEPEECDFYLKKEEDKIIEKACKMVGWTKEEFYEESEKSGYSPKDLAIHLIKEERMSKTFERLKES